MGYVGVTLALLAVVSLVIFAALLLPLTQRCVPYRGGGCRPNRQLAEETKADPSRIGLFLRSGVRPRFFARSSGLLCGLYSFRLAAFGQVVSRS